MRGGVIVVDKVAGATSGTRVRGRGGLGRGGGIIQYSLFAEAALSLPGITAGTAGGWSCCVCSGRDARVVVVVVREMRKRRGSLVGSALGHDCCTQPPSSTIPSVNPELLLLLHVELLVWDDACLLLAPGVSNICTALHS